MPRRKRGLRRESKNGGGVATCKLKTSVDTDGGVKKKNQKTLSEAKPFLGKPQGPTSS